MWAAFSLSVLCALLPRVAGGSSRTDVELAAEAGARYEAIWAELDIVGRSTVERFSKAGTLEVQLGGEEWFRVLERQLSHHQDDAHTLLVIDGTGSAEAWAGPGLLHPVEAQALPAAGRGFRMSFSAITLFSVFPLEEGRRPRRLVVGRSFDRDLFPWRSSRVSSRSWAVRPAARDGTVIDEPAWIVVPLEDTPTLLLAPEPWAPAGSPGRVGLGSLAWALAALALLGVAFRRGRGARGLESSTTRALFCAGLGAVAVIGGAGAIGSAAVAVAALLALHVLVRPIETSRPLTGGLFASLVAVGGVWLLRQLAGTAEIGSLAQSFFAMPGLDLALRATLGMGYAAVLGAFRGQRPGRGDRLGTPLGILALLAAAALAGSAVLALPLLWLGALGCATGLAAPRPRLSFAWSGRWLVVASLASAVAWQIAVVQAEESRWIEETLPRLTEAPSGALEELVTSTRSAFDGVDVSELFLADSAGVVPDDLAYALWRRSSLAVDGTLSAVVVIEGERVLSSFSIGLPVDDEGSLDRDSRSWDSISDLVWEDALDGSEVELLRYGRPWATMRFWIAVLPAYRGVDQALDDLVPGLLRGGPAAAESAALLPGSDFVLYGDGGTVLSSPWAASPPQPVEGSPHEVETPKGRSRIYSWREPRGMAAMFVPALRPGITFERAGVQAVGTMATLGGIALLWFALGLRREGLIDGARAVLRSYPRRLLVVYTVLLLVPLLFLNAILLRTISQRLEHEKRASGIAAMEAAEAVLGDYVVSLEPGFVLETEVDDNLLLWLSQVVGHDLNLYWGSRLSASSKRELFTAGFLPERIPGEVYSRLSTGKLPLASRPRSAGGVRYLEFYAPLQLPGVDRFGANLFLSTPLLAQEEALASEIAALRRRALLASTALFLLLLAVGGALARNFTAPIMALVRGTERIAAGEGRLGIEPRDTELMTLSRAIDDMADRIARARRQLQREKEVVESMVENITAGVVSLDSAGRVLMANRVAKELLGVAIGEPLEASCSRDTRLRPLLDFVAGDPVRLRRETLRLPAGADAEEGADAIKEWSTVWVPLAPEGELGALLVVEDVTEVLRGQRLEAWAEMARMIAHEIKNPLTPIRLSTEHLREVHAAEPERIDEIFERCTTNILKQVDELRVIASEFATYSRIPKIDPVTGDLVATVVEIVEGYAAQGEGSSRVRLETDLERLDTRFDPKLIGRALRNLIENAIRASNPQQTVTVGLEVRGESAAIQVVDQGPGVDADDLDRIFEPYFSTHETGTGLGLPITRRIAEEHGGSIRARNRPEGGLEVSIRLPLERDGVRRAG